MRRLLKILGLLLMAGLVLAGGAAVLAWRQLDAPGPLAAAKPVVVPRGGVDDIAGALLAQGVISQPRLFSAAALLTRSAGPLRAAEFEFPAQASIRQVLAVLREARPVQRRLTIPEGFLSGQIAALLQRTEGLIGELPAIPEGSVLPETYSFQWGDTRAAVVRRAQEAMDRALAEAWASRAPNLPLASPREALVLASIIERETGVASERARVGGVFVNRLRRGMMLQSDPTTAYAVSPGMPLDRPLTRADLDRDHPFNTYRVRGLPPGPIASPGRESLRAATQPEATEFLFFVADGTGGHAFARTLEEHNRNVARWRAR
ncbi:MAG: endolytic transglycosylase MltG [Acetobacteraceae bacterium]|nr:endolytic transglycosylase MltG [Acetobacteraceae bacterium]